MDNFYFWYNIAVHWYQICGSQKEWNNLIKYHPTFPIQIGVDIANGKDWCAEFTYDRLTNKIIKIKRK